MLELVTTLIQGLENHWSNIRPEMKSAMGRIRIFSQPGAPVLAMSATVTQAEVSAMIKSVGLRDKPEVLRASPVLPHHKFVPVRRPPNTSDPEGKKDKDGKEKPGFLQLLRRIFLNKYFESIKQNLSVKKTLMIFRDEQKMVETLELCQEELPDYENENSPFVMNHGGLGPVTTNNIISRKNEISLYLSTSKMLMGIDIEEISIVIFVRPLNMMHYVIQGTYIARKI